jgi:L-threonylcarbamoyladenylate synthase
VQKVKVIIYKRLKMLKNHLNWAHQEDIRQLVTSLMQGNISICTTDTVLGLIAPITQNAFDKLNKLKGRSEKPYLVLIPNAESVQLFSDCKFQLPVKRIINSGWPGPLTLIIKAKESLPAFMKSQEGTIALRVPDHAGLQSVMKQIGPVFSTSANLQGQPTPTQIEDVDPEIMNKISLIIKDKERAQGTSLASTILDCTGQKIKLVREGAYPIEALEAIAQQRFVT